MGLNISLRTIFMRGGGAGAMDYFSQIVHAFRTIGAVKEASPW